MSQSEYAKFVNGSTDNVTIFKSQFIDKLNEKGIYGDYKATAATWNEIKSSIDKGRPVVVFKKKQKEMDTFLSSMAISINLVIIQTM